MIGLDLFSGIGGLSIALEGYARPVAYCENDRYAQAILMSRQRDGRLPIAPIWDDVRTLKGNVLPASIDIIWGGFPCQDISVAGCGKGLEGERSGLFFEILRLAEEIKPKFIFLENVPAIRTRGLNRVGYELAELGYDLRWCTLSAQEVGANHKRERWFCLAHSNNRFSEFAHKEIQAGRASVNNGRDDFSYSYSMRKLQQKGCFKKLRERTCNSSWWKTEPNVGRVADGVQFRVDRIKCLGNAVVPFQARTAFESLIGLNSLNEFPPPKTGG